MKLEGTIINFLSDSITEGCGTTAPDKVFHQLISEKSVRSFLKSN